MMAFQFRWLSAQKFKRETFHKSSKTNQKGGEF